MPKKAIVASSRGRGLRLALLRLIKQSGYESGSSTQQPTQQSCKKPIGSLTQKSETGSSIQQAKQTMENYAFPIQTLMALQDQGLTKINKKSWAEICIDSDEEIDLAQLITQVAKKETIIQNPKGKAIVSNINKSQNSSQKTQTNHVPTNKFSNIIQIEPEFWDESSNKEPCVPVMLKFFSIFSLAWVFSWQYKHGKSDHPKAFPIFQRHAYVKWWSQFDSSMAYPDKFREWFKDNKKSQKISDPETASFLNQRAQIQAALAWSQSRQPIKGKLQQILYLLQEDEDSSSVEENEEKEENKDDYFGINLEDD
ncbi:hypothetical protein PIB30_099821 [Stylosanthes scabra]|uniref:Uncharacterized protein n=1 Tax=Stylosanthes scabra TaxID=79078 RepID=A0ABU6XUK4_9FABA|nr:hypothetical protein [Stylosanthes scabra]